MISIKRGWRPAAFNQGWNYTDRANANANGEWLINWMANRYRHSSKEIWSQRLEAGEIRLNDELIYNDILLETGNRISWQRPPWLEGSIPDRWETIFDNGDLLVINKPAGLPVVPGGGFLLHTLTALLEPIGAKPVHRLGRLTSGLQVCARQPKTLALLSKKFQPEGGIRKIYQAWARRVEGLDAGEKLLITNNIVERQHTLLDWIWGPESLNDEPIRRCLAARTELKLLERREKGDLLEVKITTGRPHQIRIHLAQIGSPLIGDPLYLMHREISQMSTPGEGSYFLHAWRLVGIPPFGENELIASLPVNTMSTFMELYQP